MKKIICTTLTLATIIGNISNAKAVEFDIKQVKDFFDYKLDFKYELPDYLNIVNSRDLVENTKKALLNISFHHNIEESLYSTTSYIDRWNNINNNYRYAEDNLKLEHKIKTSNLTIKHKAYEENYLSSTRFVAQHNINSRTKFVGMLGVNHNIRDSYSPLISSDIYYELDPNLSLKLSARHGLNRYYEDDSSTIITGSVNILLK